MASEIDQVAADNADAKLCGIINFTDELSDEYIEKIEAFGVKLNLKHVALTTTNDGGKFKVNDDADVTVMHYKGKKVAYNYATKGELSDEAIKEIVKGAGAILE